MNKENLSLQLEEALSSSDLDVEKIEQLIEDGAVAPKDSLMILFHKHLFDKDFWDAFSELLLQNGADVDATNSSGQTLLVYVAAVHAYEIIELLMKHKANPYIKDEEGNDAFCFYALYENEHLEDAEKYFHAKLTMEEYPYLKHYFLNEVNWDSLTETMAEESSPVCNFL